MWITLHSANDEEFDVNMDKMETYGIISKNNYAGALPEYLGLTYLVPAGLKDEQNCYVVKESPEEIRKMVRVFEVPYIVVSDEWKMSEEDIEKITKQMRLLHELR